MKIICMLHWYVEQHDSAQGFFVTDSPELSRTYEEKDMHDVKSFRSNIFISEQ